MTAAAIAIGVLGGLAFAAIVVAATWVICGRVLAGRCVSCAHGLGLHDRYSGKCAGRVNTAWWLHKWIGVRQFTACKCVRREVTP
jgi:hypothetical protein